MWKNIVSLMMECVGTVVSFACVICILSGYLVVNVALFIWYLMLVCRHLTLLTASLLLEQTRQAS